ncbi:MAG: hypothetical protein R3C52_12705 [Hyphomonadaceae bacterium]
MRVSWRHMAVAICGLPFLTGAPALAQAASSCCAVAPARPTPTPSGCCVQPTSTLVNVPRQSTADVTISVPGVSVAYPTIAIGAASVNVSANATASAGVGVYASGGARAGGSAGGYGFSGGYAVAETGAAFEEESADVAGESADADLAAGLAQAAFTEQAREETVLRPIEGVCLAEGGASLPAISVYKPADVDPAYAGELFRCDAGERLEAHVGVMDGRRVDFSQAETIQCAPGEALWHAPGGRLQCRPSLLQASVSETDDLLDASVVKFVLTTITRAVRAPAASSQVRPARTVVSGRLDLDGGVGQSVW